MIPGRDIIRGSAAALALLCSWSHSLALDDESARRVMVEAMGMAMVAARDCPVRIDNDRLLYSLEQLNFPRGGILNDPLYRPLYNRAVSDTEKALAIGRESACNKIIYALEPTGLLKPR